ncbi:hypothetical protein JCM4814A_90320 [Streptomyces phaeofaciens JCM 4814]
MRTVVGLALNNLLRTPGRTVLGAAGLALGVAAFTVLLSLTLAFRGEVAGSLLGNAVVAQARTADYLSVALSLLLGAPAPWTSWSSPSASGPPTSPS